MHRLIVVAIIAVLAITVRVQTRLSNPQAIRVEAPRATTPIERGREVYRGYGCAMCHGADGAGGLANANAETDGKIPGVLYVAEGYSVEELRQRIRDGLHTVGKADPKGPTPPFRMPGWRDRMPDAELEDLVQYLMSLLPEGGKDTWR